MTSTRLPQTDFSCLLPLRSPKTLQKHYISARRDTEIDIVHPLFNVVQDSHLNYNNLGEVLLTQNTKNNIKVKHIDIRYHYICKRVEDGEIEVRRVASTNNLTDMFTKQLPRVTFQKHCATLWLYEGPSSQGECWSRLNTPSTTAQAAHICVMSQAVLPDVSLYFYLSPFIYIPTQPLYTSVNLSSSQLRYVILLP